MRLLAAVFIALAVPGSALAATTTTSGDTKAPTIKITGLPPSGSCLKTSTRVRFRIVDTTSGVRNITVYLDGKTIGKHVPGSGALKIKFPKVVKAGRHRLGVLASDKSGNVSHKVTYFRVC